MRAPGITYVTCLLTLLVLSGVDQAATGSSDVLHGQHSSDVVVDDFEDVTDWSGLATETSIVRVGAGAGRWSDHAQTTSVRKDFVVPLDASHMSHLQVWVYSDVANSASIELILDSDNDADPAGWDYYIHRITVDWTGWRLVRVPLEHFGVARNPLGWHTLNHVRFSASGWGHEPLADTSLVFDDMRFGAGVIEDVRVDTGYLGRDFVFTYTLQLVDRLSTTRRLGLEVARGGCPFEVQLPEATIPLSADGGAEAIVRVIVSEDDIEAGTALETCRHDLTILETALVVDGLALESAVPLPSRSRPRLLLDAADLARIQRWSGEHAWAASARDGVVAAADAWPGSFTDRYYVDEWALPPEGGQWGMWYICPDHGVSLRHDGPGTHVCPVDGTVHTGWPYDQVIYARMHRSLANAALDLALSYQLTGETDDAMSGAEILLAYADRYLTYPIHNVQGEPGGSGAHILSQTLDESSWIITMAWAYDLLAESPAFTAADRSRVEHGMLRPAAALIGRNQAGKSNWQSWHNAAIGAVGFALQDPFLIARAVKHPTNGFEFQMENSVSSDGFWYEGAWGYHFFALSAHRYLAEMAGRAGLDLYGHPGMRSMFFGPLSFSMPDGMLPPFNDSRTVSLVGQDRLYESAYRRYGDAALSAVLGQRNRRREALFWGAETLPDGRATDLPSMLFRDSGYAVMRAGASTDATYVALDFGPHGGGHGHYDKLGFVMHASGATMAIDPGTQSYAAPTHKTWDKETVAHNAVVVDGTTQAAATGRLHRYVALPGLSMAAADDGEANALADVLRTMVVAPEYVVDRVHAVGTDDLEHTFDWTFHGFAEQTVSLPVREAIVLPDSSGYQHLTDRAFGDGSGDWSTRFDQSAPFGEPYGGAWSDPSDVGKSFTRSDEQAASGAGAGKLAYDFSSAPGYIVFSTARPSERDETPADLGLSLHGDGSGHSVTLRVYDSTDERFVFRLGAVDWHGWRAITATNVISWSHYLGNDDGVFDPPVNSIAVQLNHEEGGTDVGALFVDDISIRYADGPVVSVEDFEHQPVGLHLRMLGEPGTAVVTGRGLGPDLLEPLPMALVRRESRDTVFTTLLEPMADAPAVTTFRTLSTDARPDDEALALVIGSGEFSDMLLAVADGPAGRMRTFGPSACDGVLCLFRARPKESARYLLVDGSELLYEDHPHVSVDGGTDGIQVDFIENGAVLDITLLGAISGRVSILGPLVTEVLVNGVRTEFHREGGYVVLGAGAMPSVYLPMVTPGS